MKLKKSEWLEILKSLEGGLEKQVDEGTDGEEGILSLTGNEKVLLAGS